MNVRSPVTDDSFSQFPEYKKQSNNKPESQLRQVCIKIEEPSK